MAFYSHFHPQKFWTRLEYASTKLDATCFCPNWRENVPDTDFAHVILPAMVIVKEIFQGSDHKVLTWHFPFSSISSCPFSENKAGPQLQCNLFPLFTCLRDPSGFYVTGNPQKHTSNSCFSYRKFLLNRHHFIDLPPKTSVEPKHQCSRLELVTFYQTSSDFSLLARIL